MGKSASAPDPYATAQAQGGQNKETARVQSRLSNADTIGPTGSVTHEWRPDDTVLTKTTLSPGQQSIFDAVQGGELSAAQRMQKLLGTGVDTSGLGAWGNIPQGGDGIATGTGGNPGAGIASSIPGAGQGIRSDFTAGAPMSRMSDQDYGAQRAAVEQAIMSRVQPQYDRDRETMDSRLAAQGFNAGSRGYQNAADETNRSLTDARMQAVLAGGQEQSRLAGLDQSRLGFNNQASQQDTTNWNNMLAAINSGQQQGFSQNRDNAAFGNEAQKQAYQQHLSEAGFGNAAQQQRYNEQFQSAQGQNNQRTQQLAETLQLRSQPVNEVASLFGLGNQIATPAAQQFQGTPLSAPNYAQMVQNQFAADSANATSTNNATAQGLSTAAMAAMMLL